MKDFFAISSKKTNDPLSQMRGFPMSKNFESEQEESTHNSALGRRQFLISLGKWSPAVIGGLVLGGVTGNAEAWNNRGGSWVNRSGGGGWVNRSGGGWHNRGGSWVNRSGGGGWYNRNGGWHNRGGSWVNRSGGGHHRGGSWINR